jgi:hypothetical protein
MSQTFDTDAWDDLFYEGVEGPARQYRGGQSFEEFEDEFAEDYGEDYGEDLWDEGDAFEDQDAFDAMEEAVADALGADESDEFFRRLARGIRGVARRVGGVVRRVAPVVGRIARTVAPIASMIPIPQAQLIGRVAGLVGRLTADEADEFDALDEMLDFAEDEDAIDAAAPVIAGLTIRSTIPNVARLPRQTRRQLVRSVTQATRTLARRQGPQAARAVPAVVRQARRVSVRRRLAPQALPRAVARTASQVARSPRLVRRLARTTTTCSQAQATATCPNCGQRQRFRLAGPVRMTVQGR